MLRSIFVSSRRALALALLSIVGLSHAQEQRTVEIPAQQARTLRLATTPAVAATTIPLGHLAAEVSAPLESTRIVSTPFAGVVVGVAVDDGEHVDSGEVLAQVQSRDFLAARAELARSGSESALAASRAQRDASLLAEGIIAKARAEESRARAAVAAAQLAQAREALAGTSPPELGAGGEYVLRAPLAGRVLHRAIAPGQAVAAFAPAFTIAAGSGVDVLIQAPIEFAASYAPGQAVTMDDGTRGKVVAAGVAAEGGSQNVRLRAHLPQAGPWLVGQRGSVRLDVAAPPGALRVPLSALIADGARTQVFVAEGDRYRAVPVERLGGDDDAAIVRGALEAGAPIVSSGASTLQALLEE